MPACALSYFWARCCIGLVDVSETIHKVLARPEGMVFFSSHKSNCLQKQPKIENQGRNKLKARHVNIFSILYSCKF